MSQPKPAGSIDTKNYLSGLFTQTPKKSTKSNSKNKSNKKSTNNNSKKNITDNDNQKDTQMEDDDMNASHITQTQITINNYKPIPTTSKITSLSNLNNINIKNLTNWESRTNQGKILFEFGSSNSNCLEILSNEIIEIVNGKEKNYKFMYDKLQKKSNVLLNRLEKIGSKILQYYGFEYSQPLSAYSDQSAVFVGRILCESMVGDDTLNPQSILLEGLSNTETSDCRIIKLNFDNYQLEKGESPITLFPGQVVAVKGINTIQYLKVEKLYTEVSSDSLNYMEEEVINEGMKNIEDLVDNPTKQLKIMVGMGPFTLPHNILYHPLEELVKKVEELKPNVLVLIGPFVSEDNFLVNSMVLNRTFEDVFENEVLKRLESISKETKVVLIPSLKDIHADFVFPQPSFNITNSGIHSFNNPSTFGVKCKSSFKDEVIKVGVTSIDVLKDIVKKEFTFGHVNDKFEQILKTIVGQECYYPQLMPSEEIPLDFSLSENESASLDIINSPQILILPSDEDFYVKHIDNKCVIINPTRCCCNKKEERITEGSYAFITICNETILPIEKRTHVQIINL
ncbi:hypothetical protein ABK040_000186 [Willaertia magna]